MPATATRPRRSEGEAPAERNRTLLLSLGVLLLTSVVIAAVVIVGGLGDSSPPVVEPVAQVRISGRSMLVGDPGAGTRVEVREDFGSQGSRAFDLASRDFLRIVAAQGKVLVTYRPVRASGSYGQEAMRSWAAATDTGDPARALALHDRIFDRQPVATTPRTDPLPVVSLDGARLAATDGTALADRLQRRLLQD